MDTPETIEMGAYDVVVKLSWPEVLHPTYGTPRCRDTRIHIELESPVPAEKLRAYLVGQAAQDKFADEVHEVRGYELAPCHPDTCPRPTEEER